MRRSSNRKRKGFTLVEVMVAIAIFSVVAISLFQMLAQGFVYAQNSRDINRATQTLQYQMETLRATTWANLVAMAGTTTIQVNDVGVPVDTGGVVPFDWAEFSMTQVVALEKTDHYNVVLVLSWTDRNSRQHFKTYRTWFTKNGLNEFYTRSSS